MAFTESSRKHPEFGLNETDILPQKLYLLNQFQSPHRHGTFSDLVLYRDYSIKNTVSLYLLDKMTNGI
jgi:DNA polymerase III epsilon subunit-like protein